MRKRARSRLAGGSNSCQVVCAGRFSVDQTKGNWVNSGAKTHRRRSVAKSSRIGSDHGLDEATAGLPSGAMPKGRRQPLRGLASTHSTGSRKSPLTGLIVIL